ncbi:MAG: RNA polymerase factor sigma-54, partial [Nitrospirae bacterium]|nr:RNA polymerase factor sigma-54 [Nitrospirota bacterium]
QSIKLLQLPQLELSQTLNQELMENPFLEEIVEKEPEEKTQDAESLLRTEGPVQDTSEDILAPLEKMFGFTSDEYFEERGSDGRDVGYFTGDSETPSPFERNTRKMNLYEYLRWQLQLLRISDDVKKTAEIVIGNINEDGYLQASVEDISEMAQVENNLAEEAIALIQGFDPPGVGAKNVQECLLLQMKNLSLENTLIDKILTEGFEELEKKKYKVLVNKLKVSMDEILSAVKVIEGFEPRPGKNYSSEEIIHVIPDVYILEDSDGNFIIMLNDEGMPRFRLSNYYRKLLSKKDDLGREERQFLDDKLRSAIWLMKSLDQRNKTIYRVTESILKFQEDFLRKGVQYLKPLTLKDVATDVGMHESNISRVTFNKYLQCPRGLFDFKVFFSNAVQGGEGDVSSSIVKDTIKHLIAQENTQSPLSDREIVETLKGMAINVARRTVAKYREDLKIQSHSRRKKWT